MSFDITCPTIANSSLDKTSDYESDSNSSFDKFNFLLSNNGIFIGHYDEGMQKLSYRKLQFTSLGPVDFFIIYT